MLLVRQGKMARWINIVALLAVSALFLNSQCSAFCFAALCERASIEASGDCHESSHPQKQGTTNCDGVQSNLQRMEASPHLANATAYPPVVTILLPVEAQLWRVAYEPAAVELAEQRGQPPGSQLFLTFSVLRI